MGSQTSKLKNASTRLKSQLSQNRISVNSVVSIQRVEVEPCSTMSYSDDGYIHSYQSFMPPWTLNSNPVFLPSMEEDVSQCWEFVKKEANVELFFTKLFRILSQGMYEQRTDTGSGLRGKIGLKSVNSFSLKKDTLKRMLKLMHSIQVQNIEGLGEDGSIPLERVMSIFASRLVELIKRDGVATRDQVLIVEVVFSVAKAYLMALKSMAEAEGIWSKKVEMSFISAASIAIYLMLPNLLKPSSSTSAASATTPS